jgi:predicted esterase YcpF (UPF0227 family)
MKQKILFLHGLESSNKGEKVDFLKEQAEVLAPKIDYQDEALEEKLMYIVENFRPDFIIGSSMGGYVGMLLANRYGIKNLLYNPAIHSRSIEPKLNRLNIIDPNHFVDFNIVLGNQDDVIDPNVTESMLLDAEVVCEIERVDMKHRIDFNVFVNMYNKYINYEL